jgi:hypothetical protein
MIFIAIIELGTGLAEWTNQKWTILVSIVFMLLFWGYNRFNKQNTHQPYYRTSLFIAAIALYYLAGYPVWLAALYVAAGIAEGLAKFPEEIGFNNDQVVFNTLPKKVYNWNEFSNILIKDGVITIDFKNNRLFQKDLQEPVYASLEKEFNAYAQEQLRISAESGK